MPATSAQRNWITAFLMALAAALGYGGSKVVTPTPPPVVKDTTSAPTKDTVPVSAPPTKDTTVIKVPPSKDTTVVTIPTPPATYKTLLADSVAYTSQAQLEARISSNVGGTGGGSSLYNDGPNAGSAVLDNTISYHGHATIAYKQAAGSGLIPEMWVGIQGGAKHLWVKEAIRFSPGWSTNGTTADSKAYKMFGFSYAGSEGSGRLEITNGTEYELYWGVGTIAPEAFDLKVGNITTEWTDGQFYTYVYDIDFSAGSYGIVRLWIGKDGVTPALRGTVKIPANGTLPPLGAINFGMNFNNAQRSGMPAQQLNLGGWEIVDGSKYANPFNVGS